MMPQNGPVRTTFRNNSPHRADVHFDDGTYGELVSTVGVNGGEATLSAFPHFRFFVTLHGEIFPN